jgi:hypothetical protein
VRIEEKEILLAVVEVGFDAGERSWVQDIGGWHQQLSCASDHEAAVDLTPLLGMVLTCSAATRSTIKVIKMITKIN